MTDIRIKYKTRVAYGGRADEGGYSIASWKIFTIKYDVIYFVFEIVSHSRAAPQTKALQFSFQSQPRLTAENVTYSDSTHFGILEGAIARFTLMH